MYYLEGLLALLEEYRCGQETSCLVTTSGMAAILTAVEEFCIPRQKYTSLVAAEDDPELTYLQLSSVNSNGEFPVYKDTGLFEVISPCSCAL